MVEERLTPRAFSEADKVHQARYHLALSYVQPGARILDAACGVGYGARYLAENSLCEAVVAIDVSDEALEWAQRYFRSEKLTYIQADLSEEFATKLPLDQFDVITSFETVEHLKDDRSFLTQVRRLLKPGGHLLLSVPNEEVVPWEQANNPWHYRHYTTPELLALMQEMGFHVVDGYSQTWVTPIYRGFGGHVNVVVCQNVEAPAVQFNALEKISATCQVLATTDNEVATVLPLVSLKTRFDEMLAAQVSFAQALKLTHLRQYDRAIALASQIEPSLCPERDYVLGTAYEGRQEVGAAVAHYRRLLARRDGIKVALVRRAEERLAAIAPQALERPVEEGQEATAPQARRLVAYGDWDVVSPERFLDEGGLIKLQRLLAYTEADVVLAPVLYELVPEHRVARWEPVAWRRGGEGERLEKLRVYVNGDTPDLWYGDAYEAFKGQNYEQAFSLFADHYESTTDPMDQVVLVRWLVLCLVELEKDEEAVELLTDALQVHPEYADLRYLLVQILRLNGETGPLEEVVGPALNAGDSVDYPEFFYDIRGLLLRYTS